MGDEDVGEVTVDAPVASLVGVGQCTVGNLAAKTSVIQIAGHGAQASFDIAQTVAVGDREDGHENRVGIKSRQAGMTERIDFS